MVLGLARVAFNCYPVLKVVIGFIPFSLKWEATVVEGDLKTKQIVIKLNGTSKNISESTKGHDSRGSSEMSRHEGEESCSDDHV